MYPVIRSEGLNSEGKNKTQWEIEDLFGIVRAENPVPDLGTHPVAVVGILEVMFHVMLLEHFEIAVFDVGMVHRVVGHVVEKVTGHITYEVGSHPKLTQNEVKEEIKTYCEGNADAGNHHQTEVVIGIVVVYTVEQKVQTLAHLARGFPVKNEAMQDVLGESPDKDAQSDETGNFVPGKAVLKYRAVEKIKYDRDKDHQWHRKMYPGKLVQQVAFEHSYAFVFCGYKGLFHTTVSGSID